MSNEDKAIVEQLNKIRAKYFKISYNIFDYLTNDTEYYKESRCKEFAIYFVLKGKLGTLDGGVLVELKNGNFVISVLSPNEINSENDINKIIKKLPIRFQEIIAKIKKLKKDNEKITKNFIEEILLLSVHKVPDSNIEFIEEHESLNSVIVFNFYNLCKSKKHTLIYANLPILGKFNRKKRRLSR